MMMMRFVLNYHILLLTIIIIIITIIIIIIITIIIITIIITIIIIIIITIIIIIIIIIVIITIISIIVIYLLSQSAISSMTVKANKYDARLFFWDSIIHFHNAEKCQWKFALLCFVLGFVFSSTFSVIPLFVRGLLYKMESERLPNLNAILRFIKQR